MGKIVILSLDKHQLCMRMLNFLLQKSKLCVCVWVECKQGGYIIVLLDRSTNYGSVNIEF